MGSIDNKREKFLAILIGAAIGATVAVLYAPDSGKVTRTKIKDEVVRGSNKVAEEAKSLTKDLKQNLGYGGDSFGYIIGSIIARTVLTLEEVAQIVKEKLSDMTLDVGHTEEDDRIIELPVNKK